VDQHVSQAERRVPPDGQLSQTLAFEAEREPELDLDGPPNSLAEALLHPGARARS
jgi:hypothetical protein